MNERDAFDLRPTPDEVLARLRAEGANGRGRLRVYLGMAPGVGKTYRMLEEAHRRVERGTDLVVGYVEPHGRPLTAALLEGLEVVPRRRFEYRGVVVEEMDTDAVLQRGPTVALVDELAHTNVPGSPREKRWQDVEALQDAGVHVISTLNIQHLESLADAVATITGAPVNERLPDRVLARADEIELVDMSPHALRQRMRHGNVYAPEQAQVALDRFFTEANLTALRELALRLTARRVEGQLEGIATEHLNLVTERVLVLVDGSPSSARAIRHAAALAGAINAALVAVIVETPETEGQAWNAGRDLKEDLDDAVDLGAQVVRVRAVSLADGLVEVAGERRATHLVLPHSRRRGMPWLARRPLVDQVLERLPDLEGHVVAARRPEP